ncbi:glycosyltransferase [Conexibacter stalactiti]|uniref:Glycosyltransferase n=1 Tax=Conexibacter stalactiti TaxID=1940611 RepID=A0ABU4HN82_9ACTN|nr:glycosyltransferase [Conexibacter stalactiti]MDW5594768.1 glycosyltransferase [Conexibacter stalactiti]MEC5035410.1 glycosyltransferase [Conexibacter stalactiti]
MPPADVALITPYPAPGDEHGGRSGVAAYGAALAHALAGHGAEVTVLAPEEDDAPLLAADGPVRVERPFRRGPGALLRAAHAARASGAAVTHVQHELFLYGGPSSVPALAPALRALRDAVVTMHHVVDPATVDDDFVRLHRVHAPRRVAQAGLAGVQRTIRRRAGAVIVHEPAFARIVPEAEVVPHGLPARPAPDAGERAAARAALGLDDRLTVLCFGFLAPYKGLELALDAAALTGPDVRLVVAGGPHPRLVEDGDPYAHELRERHGAHADFVGRVPEAEVSTWFTAADVALFPYPRPFAASGPLALALAHRTPVLLSPQLASCTAAPLALTAPASARELAALLDGLAAAPGELERLREAAGAVARDRAWPAVAGRHLELYEEVQRGKRSARRRLRAA